MALSTSCERGELHALLTKIPDPGVTLLSVAVTVPSRQVVDRGRARPCGRAGKEQGEGGG
jgi:hypothetical protein